MTVIILKGLPACGKTTFAKNLIDERPGEYKRVNKDDLRSMLDNGRWSKHNEKFVLKLRDMMILEALEGGWNVIVDDTNLHHKHEQNIRELVKGKAQVEVYDVFETDPKVCIERDLKRANSVGAKVIMGMYNQFMKDEVEKYVGDPTLPQAAIFDIDGTLAIKGDRSPYEWQKVGLDTVNSPVANVLTSLIEQGYKIILMSGRDSVCRPETVQWLKKHDIHFDELYMRAYDDRRKDWIVKRELFDRAAAKYNIDFVIDDRKQVVDMWRSIGLTCFQVAEGDF